MAMSSPELNRSQSFQNCRETDIPGYNDCPNFMYPQSSGIEPKRLVSRVTDTSGNTKTATAPPPSMKRRVSEKLRAAPEAGSSVIVLSPDELAEKYQWIVSVPSKLQEKEFAFYKSKVDRNLEKLLDNPGTRMALSDIFGQLEDPKKVSELFTKWMLADVSVNSWCPSLRKLVENAEI